jgi:hypothetical protein
MASESNLFSRQLKRIENMIYFFLGFRVSASSQTLALASSETKIDKNENAHLLQPTGSDGE